MLILYTGVNTKEWILFADEQPVFIDHSQTLSRGVHGMWLAHVFAGYVRAAAHRMPTLAGVEKHINGGRGKKRGAPCLQWSLDSYRFTLRGCLSEL